MKFKKRGFFMKKVFGHELKGSLTVEAAYVIAVVLMSLAGLMKFSFKIHDEVSANFVMNEGMEIAGHSRNPDLLSISESGNERLEYALYLRDSKLGLEGEGKKLSAKFTSEEYTKLMSDKGFEPEKLMRMITLIEKADDGNED